MEPKLNKAYQVICSYLLKVLLALLCVHVPQITFPQTLETDSIEMMLEDLSDDSNKVKELLRLSREYSMVEQVRSINFAIEALNLSQEIRFLKGEIEATYTVARGYGMLENPQKAIEYLLKVSDYVTKVGDKDLESKVFINLGYYNALEKMEDQSMRYFDEAEAYIVEQMEIEPTFSILATYVYLLNQKSSAYRQFGKDDEALELLEKKLKLIEENDLGDERRGITLNNMGEILTERGDYEKAYQYHQESYAIKVAGQKWFRASNAAGNLGDVCLKMGKLKEADLYLDQSDEYAILSGHKKRLIQNIEIRAELALARGKHKLAYEYLKEFGIKSDSLAEATHSQKVSNMLAFNEENEKRYQLELLEAENAKVQAENIVISEQSKRQTSYMVALFACLGIFLLLIGGLIYNSINSRKKKRILERKNKQIEEQLGAINTSKAKLENLYREQQALVQIVIHDLKAPLHKTLGLVNMMESSGELNPTQAKFVNLLLRVNEDAGKLVNNLVELNALEAGSTTTEFSELNAGALLEEVADNFAPIAAKKSIQLKLNLPQEGLQVKSQREDLVRILDNLISNALKFSHSDKSVHLSLKKNEKKVVFSVKDEGPGISKEDQKRMFRKFQKLSARPTAGESSSGLGLSIVKALVERLGGEIKVQSEPGAGAEFEVSLPAMSSIGA